MSDLIGNGSANIKDAADAVKGLVESIPVYEDVIQPAAKEVGIGLQTLAKTIHIALAPVSALVWGYEKICDYISKALENRLKDVPPEKVITPDPAIAGPALEALRFAGHKEDLRELYANLLATAMNEETASSAHPAFVEILKQINSDEAKILSKLTGEMSYPIIKIHSNDANNHYGIPLQTFSLLPEEAGCLYPELGPTYLENIARFGLAEISYETYSVKHSYDLLENHEIINEFKAYIIKEGKRPEIKWGSFRRTSFGETFYNACIEKQVK